MPKLLMVFFWGLLISFLGSLPLGTLNIAAMQIGIAESIKQAILFSLGSLIVEMIYVRISLVGISWVRKQKKLMRILDWATLAIILALAFGSFWSAMHHHNGTQNVILQNGINRFLLGAMMCAVNPVQIPFWFGWSTVLFSKGILQVRNDFFNTYIVGIGLGTLLGNCVFIFGGRFVANRINNLGDYLNWVIGGIFMITAIVQLIRIIKKKTTDEQLEHKVEEVYEQEMEVE